MNIPGYDAWRTRAPEDDDPYYYEGEDRDDEEEADDPCTPESWED